MMKPRVTIYSTDHCPNCQMAKNFLDQHAITYEEINVSRDAAKQQELIILTSGHRQVPVIVIENDQGGREILKSFDRQRLGTLLSI